MPDSFEIVDAVAWLAMFVSSIRTLDIGAPLAFRNFTAQTGSSVLRIERAS